MISTYKLLLLKCSSKEYGTWSHFNGIALTGNGLNLQRRERNRLRGNIIMYKKWRRAYANVCLCECLRVYVSIYELIYIYVGTYMCVYVLVCVGACALKGVWSYTSPCVWLSVLLLYGMKYSYKFEKKEKIKTYSKIVGKIT